MTPDRLLRWLLSFPFPGALAAMQGGDLVITLEGEVLRFDGAWRAPDGQRIPCTLPGDCDAGDVHAEISRGLAIARGITGASWHNVEPEPAPSWEDIKADCVGPDLPGDDARQNRITDETDRRRVPELERERDAATSRADKLNDRLRRDDDLRSQIAVAVGLDDSASLALILDTVTRDRPDDPRAVNGLRALVAYHQAPIAFNDRPLPLAERASFVIRRLWQGRTNAANEAAALRRELSDIADALGDLPDTAEREPIGDREEHLGLSTAERLRLHFGARS